MYNALKCSKKTVAQKNERISGLLRLAMFAEAQTKIAESKTRIDELTKQMNVMVAKKVGHATTVDDVYEAYPDIEKEVDDEIDKHEWAKDAV